MLTYEESVQAGIEYLRVYVPHKPEEVAQDFRLIELGQGSVAGILLMLKTPFEARALEAWFRDADLLRCRQYAYVVAKLRILYLQHQPWTWYPAHEHLWPLLSNHSDLIHWSGGHYVSHWEAKDLLHRPDFHAYQASLAIRGEWADLSERCERILANPPAKLKKYQVDHRFYLALARGDKAGMEDALNELCSPKVARIRNHEFSFTLTEKLISTFAVVYAKIAWLHGYQVEVDSPWVPKDWLPMEPLPEYVDPHPVLQNFDIYTPFPDDWADWTPRRP